MRNDEVVDLEIASAALEFFRDAVDPDERECVFLTTGVTTGRYGR
ncbi:hypothetical protein [Natronorubrum halophilum]|nr:hypothetical protein [Natronorubrum halophilum]